MLRNRILTPSKTSFIDEYFGSKIVDNYRNLEDLNDTLTEKNWMKSEQITLTLFLGKIPNWDNYLRTRLTLDKTRIFRI